MAQKWPPHKDTCVPHLGTSVDEQTTSEVEDDLLILKVQFCNEVVLNARYPKKLLYQ